MYNVIKYNKYERYNKDSGNILILLIDVLYIVFLYYYILLYYKIYMYTIVYDKYWILRIKMS